ncbi:MAG: T9SS type A sorting domain-containing protein, partial [Paludibacter sp.]
LYIVIGNHEGELGWLNIQKADDQFNLTNSIRRKYYPNPQPNDFYSGNDLNDLFLGKRENYYAWNWGDALFVVIDPYEYTPTKPVDGWGFTLGKTQYDWFRNTLETSKAKYKFVFAHQIVGGDNLGRGGSERVDFAEMGGKNSDGSWGFDTKRPGWGKPIHQLLVENGVQIYFHGHDHIYAEQPKDGVVYLEVPQPSIPQYTVAANAAAYGYVTGTILPCAGHINVTVTADSAKVDYIGGYHAENAGIGQINGNIRRTFSVKPKVVSGIDAPKTSKLDIQVYHSGRNVIIKTQNKTTINLCLFGIAGNLIQQSDEQLASQSLTYTLPANLKSGIYLLEVSNKTTRKTIKLIL